MSTPGTQMPTDVEGLQKLVLTAAAKLMAHSQSVHELLNANMDLRAALHAAHTDKEQLQAYIHNMLNPAPAEPAVEQPVEAASADTVSA